MSLNLSPWSRKALTPYEEARAAIRARELGAHVSVTAANASGPWTVHATSRALRASRYGARGSLAVAIHACLDDFRAQADILAEQVEDLFSGDELSQLQRQSRAS